MISLSFNIFYVHLKNSLEINYKLWCYKQKSLLVISIE